MAEETPFASLPGSAPIRVNDMLYNILDDKTGEYITYSKVTDYNVGVPMTDALCDGVLFRKAPTNEYFKRVHAGSVNIQWFGAVADYDTVSKTGTDNYNAFMAAINALGKDIPSGKRRLIGRIQIPPGDYYIGQTINLYHAIEFLGESNTTRLFFAEGIDGFVLHATNTPGGITPVSKYSSDGCSFRNLSVQQITGALRGNAFVCHVPLRLWDSGINNWGGCGLYIPSNAVGAAVFKQLWRVMGNFPGSGYTDINTPPVVTVTGDGAGADVTAVLAGRVATATVTDGGDEYWSVPSVLIGLGSNSITETNIETTGYNARVNAKMGVGKIVMLSGGQSYTTATATPTGVTGTGLTLGTPVISGGVITSIPILTQGTDFTSPIGITITGDGTGASAQSFLIVVSLTFLDRGKEYETPPPVAFRGGRRGTGRDAAATTTLDTLYVKRYQINSRGSNYTYMNIDVSGGGGSGAIATAVLFKDILGNSNRCKVKNVGISNCSYGIYTEGSDSNAGLFEAVNISFCRYWAVREYSFLGNVYNTCVVQFNLGAYLMISNTGVNNLLLGCYSEDGQLTSVGVSPANLYGGDHGAGVLGTWAQPGDLSNQIETTGINSQTSIYGDNPNNGVISTWYNSTLKSTNAIIRIMDVDTGDMHIHYTDSSLPQNNSANDRIYHSTGPYTLQTFGKATSAPYSMFIDRLKIGGSMAAGRTLSNAAAIPTTGSYAAGDFLFNRAPTTADPIFGWLRVTTGSNHVDGTDWITARSGTAPGASPILAQRAVYQGADYRLVSTAGGSIISNFAGLAILGTLPNGCLNLINRNSNSYYSSLNLYMDGTTSGMHIGSISSGNGVIAAGGYRSTNTQYRVLDNPCVALSMASGSGFNFQVMSGTVGTDVTQTWVARITTAGKMAVGAQTPTAFLDVTASVAATASFRINPGAAVTAPNDGEMWYSGSHLNFRLGGSTITLDAGANLFNTDLTLPSNRNHTINGSNYIRFNVSNVPSGYVSIGDQNNTTNYVLNVNGSVSIIGTISCTHVSPTGNINTGGSILAGTSLASTGGFGCNGATPVGKQAAGVNTAAATYGTNEQSMLQIIYNAMRTFGFLT